MNKINILEADRKIAKQYELPEKFELSNEDKKSYILEQAETVNKILWRCRVELMALEMAEAKTPEQELGKETERQKLHNEMRQYTPALKAFMAIYEAL